MSVSAGGEGWAGAREGPIQWALLITQTIGPLGKAGREGLWILPWSRESTSGFLCPGFPAPSLVPLVPMPRAVGPCHSPSTSQGTKPSGRSWLERGSRPNGLWSPRRP